MKTDIAAAILIALLLWDHPASAGDDNVFDFFAQEARVVTASLQPTTQTEAPATVYVVTAEDIATSGAQTLWDALRSVPGVDVMTTRSWHGEVGIRGLNRPLNNRVLVLLDGKTVLNGFFDFVTWEAIPVALAEIVRIEVVLGPASALYGANAVNGVINIVTTPSTDADGGEIRVALGERSTRMAHVVYDHGSETSRTRGSVAWRTGDQFDSDRPASQVFKTHGAWFGQLDDDRHLRVAAGLVGHDTQLATSGGAGAAFNDGANGFLDGELDWSGTKIRGFWNRGRSKLRGFDRLREPNTDYDTFDLSLTRRLTLANNELAAGASYRRNHMRSKVFGPDPLDQDLWAGYVEDVWPLRTNMNLTLSARADWHPRAGWSFSPRASLTTQLAQRHVLRASMGTAFRTPTLTENHVDFTDRFAYDGALGGELPIETVELHFSGNVDLESEQLRFVEASYTGMFGPVRASIAGFHYRLRDIITAGDIESIQVELPVVRVTNSFVNGGELQAWGGEAGIEARISAGVRAYTNYSLLEFDDAQVEEFGAEEGGPRHKLNGGVRLHQGPWLGHVSMHWVSSTHWDSSPLPQSPIVQSDSYHLLNGHLSRDLGADLLGLRLGLDVFNLTNHRHAQLLPAQPNGDPGQAGEILGRRVLISLARAL